MSFSFRARSLLVIVALDLFARAWSQVLIEDKSPDVRSALAWVLCQLLALMNEAAYLYHDLTSTSRSLSATCPEYELLQERLDTSVFPLLLILLHDDDASVAAACLRSMALAAAAHPPPPPESVRATWSLCPSRLQSAAAVQAHGILLSP